MRYLICGLGSIGQRHLANLIQLGETDIIAYRKTNTHFKNSNKIIQTYYNFNDVLAAKPDVAIISNPSSMHVPLAIKLVKSNCHLFIEKPLSSSRLGISELKEIVSNNKRVIFIAFMMRYHPAAIQIRKWLKKNIIGSPISVRMNCGQYLPSWHPSEDYRTSYASNKNLGGGPINTLCHEIDLISWFFGQPDSITAFPVKKSSLEITTEHGAEIIFSYKNGLIIEIHLDFLQTPPKRQWEIIGDKGRIEFDYYNNKLSLFKRKNNTLEFSTKIINFKNNFNINDMYLLEMKDFIYSVKKTKISPIDLSEGINNLKILIAAHRSINVRKTINLKQINI